MTMNKNDSSTLHDRKLIISKLLTLVNNKCVLSADLGEKDNLSTNLIAIDEKANTLTISSIVVIDHDGETSILNFDATEQFNQKMTSQPYVEFNTFFRDTQVSFIGVNIKKIIHESSNAFVMDIPNSLYWHNRRKYFRKKIPSTHSSFCEIRLPKPTQNSTAEYKQKYTTAIDVIKNTVTKRESLSAMPDDDISNLIRLNLYDVSLSGCSMFNRNQEFCYFLTIGTVYENCIIVMPDRSEIKVSLEVMTNLNVELEEVTDFIELIGMKFLSIKRE